MPKVIEKIEPLYLKIFTAARMYDFKPRELRERCNQGKIPGATKTGKEWRIPKETMDALMLNGIPKRHLGRRQKSGGN